MKNKQLFTIFLIVFIDLFGFGLILPLLPYIGERYGANPFLIGLLTATYSFFQMIASPILGRLSDRYGRRKILIISQIGSAVGYILLAYANSLPLLFLSRTIDGITGGNISIAQAYIADVTTKESRAKGMGLIGAAFGLGFIFGPAIGGSLSHYGFQAPALFATAASLVTVMATYIFLTESVDVPNASHNPKTGFSLTELKRVLRLKPVGTLIIIFFLLNTAFSLMQGNFALWTEHTFRFGPSQTGWLFAYIGIVTVMIQLRILPWLLEKKSESLLLKYAILIITFGLGSLLMVAHPILLIVPLTLMPFGNGIANPLIQSLSSKNVPQEEYGGTLGLLQSAGSFGRILGPVIGGYIYYIAGKNVPFILAALLSGCTFLFIRKEKYL